MQTYFEHAEKPLRIAVVMGKHVTGGIKSVILNYYKHIDREKIQFDFLVDVDSPDKDYTEIYALGGRVYEIPPATRPIRNIIATKRILRNQHYRCVHGYLNTLNVFPLFAAVLAGTPVRIAENLSTGHAGEKKTILKHLLRPMSTLFPTHLAANSIYAAEWLYGQKNSNRCQMIRNALDLNSYHYNPPLRDKTRKQLGLEGCFVLGHIGRYVYQKNHAFLIDAFHAVYQRDASARLLLVGYGEQKTSIFQKIHVLGLDDVVVDCGATENILPLYHAMDCFVLPSFYEGLPVVGIEAQATGLPCVLSSNVTEETAVTDCVQFIELDAGAQHWAEEILRWKFHRRTDQRAQLTRKGYNVACEAGKLEQYYLACVGVEVQSPAHSFEGRRLYG